MGFHSNEWERMAKQSHLASLDRRLKAHEKRAKRKEFFRLIGNIVLAIVGAIVLFAFIYLITPQW